MDFFVFGRAGVPDKKLNYQDAIRVYGNHETYIYKGWLSEKEWKGTYRTYIKSTQEFKPLAVELLKSLSIYQLELSKVQLIKAINYRLFKTSLARFYRSTISPPLLMLDSILQLDDKQLNWIHGHLDCARNASLINTFVLLFLWTAFVIPHQRYEFQFELLLWYDKCLAKWVEISDMDT